MAVDSERMHTATPGRVVQVSHLDRHLKRLKKMKNKQVTELTQEEYDLLIAENENLKKIEDEKKNVEAERDSFRQENETLKAEKEKLEKENGEVKAMNFTLARNMKPNTDTAENALISLFGRKRGKE